MLTLGIFDCPERSLKRWIERYEEEDEIKRHNRDAVSYKITQEQIDYAITRLRENEQITMMELTKKLENRFPDFDLTPQHLGKVSFSEYIILRTVCIFISWFALHKLRKFVRLTIFEQSRLSIYKYWSKDRSISK